MPYKNPENAKRDAYFREYRRINKKKIAETNKARYEKKRDSILEYTKPRMSEWRRLSRAKARGCYVPLTEDEKKTLISIEKTRRELAKDTGKIYEIDHIIPVSCGGLHHPINVRIVEAVDNKLKSDSIIATPETVFIAKEHYRLYNHRISSEKAQEFLEQISHVFEISDFIVNEDVSFSAVNRPTLEEFLK